ncbi:hypothetical protein A2U01_0105899, partial [Trifolium medium]|nr:hypothetical protein [Trifolium medium]
RKFAIHWRLLATTGDPVFTPRPTTIKNVAWRLQDTRLATTRRAWCSVAV